ncbi:hypothetical protein B5C34_05385 [Pacificimonas flava]|uniref:Phage head morphogenesis domain-containing protein n=2 Tax=Pacificimonas TaxID=1960290 RepID=A0A219B3N0_9SPHN|nr:MULTISPECIES: phage minor head protein [Pacificimonas]MBZ6377347.1 minor capsid protein [Pacificimonas aurantium]OWV32945.1 hypothetical protein B5C34_05385 [Pacificimonas flava]
MPEPEIRASIFMDPGEPLAAWERRGDLRTSVNWREVWQDEHARAFTVAKIAKLDLLSDVRESLDSVMREGGTFEDWQRTIRPRLQRAGWWGRVRNAELTGSDEEIFVGPRRLRTIYRTNLAVSQAAGQWQRIQARKEIAPYLRYVTVGDNAVRDQHARWHGTILSVDHQAWQWLFPPNDWGCRCTVQQLTERQLKAFGYRVTPDGEIPDPPVRTTFRLSREGRTVLSSREEVRDGIGPGWNYNPGAASLVGVARKARESVDRAVALGNEEAAARVLQELVDSDDFEHMLRNFILVAPGRRPHFKTGEPTAFPVAILGEQEAAGLGVRRTVTMSGRTTMKQFYSRTADRDELADFDRQVAFYRRVPRLFRGPHLVLRGKGGEAEGRFVVMAPWSETHWARIVIGPWDDEALGIISAHPTRIDQALELVRNSEVVGDRWPGRPL